MNDLVFLIALSLTSFEWTGDYSDNTLPLRIKKIKRDDGLL